MGRSNAIALACVVALAIVLSGNGWTERKANAQGAAGERQQEKTSPSDLNVVLQSGAARYYFFKNAAESGPRRGEEIYNFKCNKCHNQYTNKVAPVAPLLEGLYKRPQLLSGEPVTDKTVGEKVRAGGPEMPAYRHTLNDQDVEDLLSYLREGCCPDPENPPANPRFRNPTAASPPLIGGSLRGGPRGKVRTAGGTPLEGILVQLISHGTSIRTTVYSNEEGEYEFPPLASGTYTLRIARPLEFRPYLRDSVRIEGPAELPEIVLERITTSEFLPPLPEIAAQLTGSEWLLNLPGTWEEKRRFSSTCGGGCHAYSQIFRNRFDEHGWRLALDRMLRYTSAFVINPNPGRRLRMVESEEEATRIVKWLARVRGPESKDPPFKTLPPPRGTATRAIVTEYALPRLRLYPHDVAGDSKGNIWYTSHRSPFIGRLDPRTGNVKEYRVPSTPGAHPGTHWIAIDKNDVVWLSDNWAHKIIKLDPRTEQFTPVQLPHHGTPLNTPAAGNMALAAEGSVWEVRNGAVVKFNPETGEYLQQYPLKRIRSTYDNMLSKDGKFWAGGASGTNLVALLDIPSGQLWELETRSPRSDPARGGFDPEGNAWFGGRGGALIKIDSKTRQVREYVPPTPFATFYEAMPDGKGEIWAGELQGGRFLRFNPRTDHWTEYVMPEPEVHDRRTWIDNSTNPVSVWYVDHNGWMVRLQPLE